MSLRRIGTAFTAHRKRTSAAEDPGIPFSIRTAETLPLPLLLLLTTILAALPDEGPSWGTQILPVLNMIFLTTITFVVSMLAAATYLRGGPIDTVHLGASMIVFCLASLLSGFAIPGGRSDVGVAIYNCGMLCTAFLNLYAAVRLPRRWTAGHGHPSVVRLALTYSGAVLLVVALYAAAETPWFPAFFLPGEGPTAFRQIILSTTVTVFFSASAVILFTSLRLESLFLKWYALGLALLGIGLLGLLFIRDLGSMLAWSGRAAQYFGGVYFLIAAALAIRESGMLAIPVDILRESHERFTSLLESSPDGIVVLTNGKFVFANQAAAAIFGTEGPGALLGKEFSSFVHSDPERSRTSGPFSWKNLPSAPVELRIVRRDGTCIQAEATATEVRYGRKRSIQAIVRDITERKNAEAALRESEERLRVTLSSIGDAVIATDDRGNVTFLNPAAATLTGWTPEEAGGEPFGDVFRVVNAVTHEPVEDLVARILRENRVVELENHTALIRRDGSELPIEDSAAPIADANGRVSGVVAVFHDVTSRRRAEEELRRSESRYRMLHESMRDAFVQVSMDGMIVECNDVFCRMLGYTGDELRTHSYVELSPERWLEMENRIVREQILTRGYSDVYEKEYRRKDGSVVPVELRTILSRDAEGRPNAMWAIVRDVTERKIVETALMEAKSQAEKANQAKTEFLAHMSHEIRTPISGIIGMVDILSSKIRNGEQREHLAMVRQAAASLLSVIGDILDLSRIESGIVELELGDWEPRKELESLLDHFRLAAERKGLSLSLDVGDSVPRTVRTDGEKIVRILGNLISNAIKYTDIGSVSVSVTRVPRSVLRLEFTVSDTGIGIPDDKKEAIFESFIRLRKSVTERNAEGTGLGLTITRRLAGLLGSTVSVDSTYGEGNRFSFGVDVQPSDGTPTGTPCAKASALSELTPLSILLVEDNMINRMFLEVKLREAGLSVTAAENGREAVAALENDSHGGTDLVLMDVQMPVMDGLEATRRIRALPGPVSGIPIIALTAFAMAGDEERFVQAGMNGYVTKPIDWEELTAAIGKVLAK